MENYSLKSNESILYKGDANGGLEVILTNLNLVLIKKTRKLFSKEQITVDVYPKENIKIYNDVPQIKQKGCSVEIYLTTTEIKIDFYSKSDVYKFVNAALELLTGKTFSARGAEKVKNAVSLVDNTLGISTVDTVKNVIEKGVVGSVLGIVGKKITQSSKGTSTISSALNATENILNSNSAVSVSHTAETDTSSNYNDQIEALKKMKDLFDAGVLTEEEFNAKKKEILGLQ